MMDADEDAPGSSISIRRGEDTSSTGVHALKRLRNEKILEKLERQDGQSEDFRSIASIQRLFSKYTDPPYRKTHKKETSRQARLEDDEAYAISLQESDESRWRETLEELDTFIDHIVTERRMNEIVHALRESGSITGLSFERCTIAKGAYETLISGALDGQPMKVKALSFSGMEMNKDSLQLIGRSFTSYSCQYLGLEECDLTIASLQDLYEGLNEKGLVSSSQVESLDDDRIKSKVLDLRGNDMLLMEKSGPDMLKRVMSTNNFKVLITNAFILTPTADEKEMKLLLVPDISGVELSYWITLIQVFNIKHIKLYAFHEILKHQRAMGITGHQLKSLSIPIKSLRSTKMNRAVAELCVGLHVEELKMRGPCPPSVKCLRLLHDYFVKNGFKFRCLSFRHLERAKGCGSVISDILLYCVTHSFEMSVALLPMLLPELQNLWHQHFHKVPVLAIRWQKRRPSYDSTSSSSDQEIIAKLLSREGSSSSSSSSSSSLSSEEEHGIQNCCRNVLNALHFVSERLIILTSRKGAIDLKDRVSRNLLNDERYLTKIEGDNLVIDLKEWGSGELRWFREVVDDTRRRLSRCKEINFKEVSLSSRDLYDLGGLVRFCDILTEITLESCGLTDVDVQDLSSALARNPKHLALLNLGRNSGLGEISARSVASLIAVRHVRRVQLIECHLEKWHDEIISPSMRQIPNQACTTIQYAENKVNLTLGIHGADVEFDGRECLVVFPRNVVSDKTDISLELKKSEPTDNLIPVTSMLRCLPSGTTLDKPMKVKLLPWLSPSRASLIKGGVKLSILTRQSEKSQWIRQCEIKHDVKPYIDFETLHFSDYEAAVEEHELPRLEANFSNILFVESCPLPHADSQVVVSWFIPNSPSCKALLKSDRLQEGLVPDRGGENPIKIEPEDHITVAIVQEPNAIQTIIRPSNPFELNGLDIIKDDGKKVKFLIKLVTPSLSEEDNVDFCHRVTRTSGANIDDVFVLKWRPRDQIPQIVPHNFYTHVTVNQYNIISDVVENVVINPLTQSIAPPVQQEEQQEVESQGIQDQREVEGQLGAVFEEEESDGDTSSTDTSST